MGKKTKLFLIVAVFILAIGLGLTIFKCCHKTEVEKLVDRYREIQEEYTYHEGEIAKLHSEADEIREIALNDYGIVFTEAGQIVMK